MKLSLWPVLVALVLLAGCPKPKPSLEYTEASGSYTSLVAKLGDDAYTDPEMTRIEGLLQKVPAESLDAAAARELLARIATERKRAASDAAAQQKAMDDAVKPVDLPDSPRSDDNTPPAQGTVDPKTMDPGIKRGMTPEELKKATGDCFGFSDNIKLRNADGTDTDGVIYERRDFNYCKDKYGAYEGRVLIFRDDKLVGNFDKGEIRHEQVKNDEVPNKPPDGQEKPPQVAPNKPAPPPQGTPPPPPAEPQMPAPVGREAPPTSPGEQTGPGTSSPEP
jgi:hypothetical protein